jgi:hypothetical protein
MAGSIRPAPMLPRGIMPNSEFLREATERGFVFQCTDTEALDDALSGARLAG